MKRFLILLGIVAASVATGQTNSPWIQQGTLLKPIPPITDIYLDSQRGIRLGEDPANGTNYVRIVGPSFMTGNRTWTVPFATNSNFVGDVASQTLTNKTLTSPRIDSIVSVDGAFTRTLPAATTNLVGHDTTDTLTNKTFDADGTGNSITNIENADIKSGAAIAYSKLNLTGSLTSSDIADGAIVNTDVNASAAIAYSKLNLSGSVTSSDITDGTIVNGDVNASAAIARSKLGTGTTNHVVINDGSTGAFSSEAQLALTRGGTAKNMTAVAGAMCYSDADSLELTAAGTSGQYLKSAGTGTPVWSAVDLASSSVTGIVPLANGGTNKAITASAGAVAYSDSDSLELTAVGSSNQVLVSNGTSAPSFALLTGSNLDSAFYEAGSISSTFTWNGSGSTSASVTVAYMRINNTVFLSVPNFSANTGTSSTVFTSNTNLPASVRPANTQGFLWPGVRDNAVSLAAAGLGTVDSAGQIAFARDGANTAFTNSSSCGLNRRITVMYTL